RPAAAAALATGVICCPWPPWTAGPLHRRPATAFATRTRRLARPVTVCLSPVPACPGRTTALPATGPLHAGPDPRPSAHHHRDNAPHPDTASVSCRQPDTP